MPPLERVLVDGLIACIPFSVVVWTSFIGMPRLWLHSLPPDIQQMAPRKTDRERALTGVMGTIVLLAFFGVPALLTWRYASLAGQLSFTETLSYLYAVWMVVNLWDLVAIDWPYAYFVDVSRPPIPGTAGAAGYKDYGFHFRGFLKASIFGLLVIVPAALVIWLAQ